MSSRKDNATHQHDLDTHEPSHSPHFFNGLTLSNILTRRWTHRHESESSDIEPLLPSDPPPPVAASLTDKYGSCTDILHYGAHSSVRVYARRASHPYPPTKQFYIVKVFRHSSDPGVRNGQHLEQSLASTVTHPNLLRAIEILHNDQRELCLVTDYCGGGDLQRLISTSGGLDALEADCFFKQVLRAVSYLHDNAVAHRDLKPENILLTAHGCVKVADFGSAQWLDGETSAETEPVHSTRKFVGSIPYLSPEEFRRSTSDARAGDVWAAGLVYTVMRRGRLMWRMPCADEDGGFRAYLRARRSYHGYAPIESLGETRCRNVIYAMLHPDPGRRIRASDVLRSEWLYELSVCNAGEMGL